MGIKIGVMEAVGVKVQVGVCEGENVGEKLLVMVGLQVSVGFKVFVKVAEKAMVVVWLGRCVEVLVPVTGIMVKVVF